MRIAMISLHQATRPFVDTKLSARWRGYIVAAKLPTALFLLGCLSCMSLAQEKRRKSKVAPQSSVITFSELADAALNEGDRLRLEWNSNSLRMALKKYATGLSYAHLANQPRREAEIAQRLGDVHMILSEYEVAIDYFSRAQQLAKALLDQRLEADIVNRLADAYLETANSRKALPYCSEAQELSRQTKYSAGIIKALNCLGVVNSMSGDVQEAQQNFEQALTLLQSEQNNSLAAQTFLNLGYLHGNLGNMQLSLDYFTRALDIWVAIHDRRKEALTWTGMAGLYALQGEKQRAMDLHHDALKLFRIIGNRNGEAAALNGIGYIYDDLGNRERALKSYSVALQLYQSIKNDSYAAITRGYLGRVYLALGDQKKALDLFYQKLATSQLVQDRRMEAYTLRDIGSVLSTTGDKKQAFDCYSRAQLLSQAVMDRRGEAYILNNIGSLLDRSGELSQALTYYRKSLLLMQAVADRRGEVFTLYEIARAERNAGNLSEARVEIEKSLALIDKLRTKVLSPSLRISYLETVYQHYEFYIDLLMRMHQQDSKTGYDILALEANERARARTLLENLIEARMGIRQGVDLELLGEETRLQQQLNQTAEQQMRLLSGKHSAEQAETVKTQLENLLAQYDEVESRVRERSPRYAALTQPRELRLPDMQNQLDQGTVLLEYSLGEEKSYGWAVTSNSVVSFELPARSEIEAIARELYLLLASGNTQKENESRAEQRLRVARAEAAYPKIATQLSTMLLAPVISLLGQRRLVIVADGLLQYIPFTALSDPTVTTSFQPLVINHEIIFLPSLSTLAILRKEMPEKSRAKEMVAVFADPVFEQDDPRLRQARLDRSSPSSSHYSLDVSFKPGRLNRASVELDDDSPPLKFQRLPFTLQEAQAIASIVPEKETKQALGFDASLKTILNAELDQYRIIHFATHGVLNTSHPELSGIVLSLIDKSGRPQNGFLRLNEIYNLELNAELVVLSACQTALGKAARGEGLIGLTRGFMYAGAARIVASLWRINDRSTAELMRYFYAGMFQQHMAPAAALRAAQIKMWETSEWRSPHHWAAFVLQGEWN
jgi:CHAT domain-containing protein